MPNSGLGPPVLEAYAGGYDPERYRRPDRLEENLEEEFDWGDVDDDDSEEEG